MKTNLCSKLFSFEWIHHDTVSKTKISDLHPLWDVDIKHIHVKEAYSLLGAAGWTYKWSESYRIFLYISGKTLMIRAKVLGRKYSQMLSNPDLKGYFFWRLPCQEGVKVKWVRIQVFVLEKPYIVYICIVEIHGWSKDRIKANEDLQPRTKLRHITKIPSFCTYPDRVPPPLLQCCLR